MPGRENPIRKNAARLGAGLVGFGLAFGGNELIKPDKPEADPVADVDTLGDSGADSGRSSEVVLPTRTEAPASLTEKINGADPVLEELLDKGYKDFTIASDGTTLEIYNADGVKALNLWPLGDKWKVTVSPDSRVPEWSGMSGINLAEPIISSGEDIQHTIDAYQELDEWQVSWVRQDANSGVLDLIGTGAYPPSEETLNDLQAQHDDELAKLENIILKSDNSLIEHPAEQAD